MTNNGFILAYAIMAGMILALLYAIAATLRAQAGTEIGAGRESFGVLVPVLAVLGMGVASYLTFVETRNVAPVCGPVGDCNAVQSSPYSRLFGFFPVGLLGLLGYVGIVAAWAVGRIGSGRLAELAGPAIFGMSLFGVLFSLYLTYLELWVIRAVCIWCLSSAVLITLIMVLSVRLAADTLGSTLPDDEMLEA